MKIKAGATIGVFLCSALLSSPRSYASEPARERVVQRFPDSGDHELGPAVFVDKSTTAIGSLRLPALSDESRTEKRSVPLAEPKDTLCGLKGVMVFIEDIDTDVENHGVSKSLLKKEVESRLRQADIPVLTADEAFNMLGKPYLYLNLTTHNTGIELYSYSLRIEFNQDVSMIRDPSIKASASTWIANVVGIVGASNLPAVTKDVTQLTDKFIHDYLAANRQ
jgi:hypothetical protein